VEAFDSFNAQPQAPATRMRWPLVAGACGWALNKLDAELLRMIKPASR